MANIEDNPEWQKAQRGELYRAFVPELERFRDHCYDACNTYNDNRNLGRRHVVGLWRNIVGEQEPLPPPGQSVEEDDQLLFDWPRVVPPVRADYGINVKLGKGVFVNFGAVFIDTCPISIGDRTICGPNISLYSGTHPLDPALRNGLRGPELGKPITIKEDCWLGGNVIVLPGVTIGRGCTIGAGSVVTKDIPDFHVAAGNPAKILRKIETAMDASQSVKAIPASDQMAEGAEAVMATEE